MTTPTMDLILETWPLVMAQVEAGGADQPPLPFVRSRSSEVIVDKEKVHTGSTIGNEWRAAGTMPQHLLVVTRRNRGCRTR
jgi:hypothetical protein